MAVSREKEKAKDVFADMHVAEASRVEDAVGKAKAKDEMQVNIFHRTQCTVAKKATVANPRTSRTAMDAVCAAPSGIEIEIVQQSSGRWRMVVTEIRILDTR